MMKTTIDGGAVAGAGATPTPVPAAPVTDTPKGKALRDKGPWRVLDLQRGRDPWATDAGGNVIPGEPGPGYMRFSLDYPADDTQLAAMLKGDRMPRHERKMRRAWAGEIVTDLPAVSVAGLLAKGAICKANGPDDPYSKPAKGEGGEA